MATATLEEEIQQVTFDCRGVQSDRPEQFDRSTIDEFEQLYLTYRARVWSLCLRMTGNPDDAEDLTQETFLRLYQKLDTFRGESAFYTWLRRLTINVVLLRFQSARWRRETPMEEITCPDPITGCPHGSVLEDIDTQLLGVADRIDLQRAIDQLPPGFKAVLILHDVEGYEHVEISELIGCSIGTSKSQLHKARVKMRKILQQTHEEQFAHRGREASGTPPKFSAMKQPVLQFLNPSSQGSEASASVAA
jgi:RNA polymerase sigma-70 factor, ECF subfamily